MKFKTILSVFVAVLMLFSCIKHEIIPAPTPKVDLQCKFSGTVNGTSTEFIQNVSGYDCSSQNEINLLNPPAQSSEIYCAEMSSTTASTPSVKIRLGKISWTGAAQTDLPLTSFDGFFTSASNILPTYKDDCTNGFNVVYKDASGTIYASHEASTNFQDAKFTNIVQESDATGDYSKFVCTFNCYVYYQSGTNPAPGLDSIRIQNGQFKGWFKK